MKFRDRLIKAEFWGDSFFFRLSAPLRLLFVGLWGLAEDSGCLEFDSLLLKCQLFGGPEDSGITPELIEQWRNQLVEAGKLIPYQAQEKEYLFIRNFHKYQTLRHYSAPTTPLPEWISFQPTPSNPHQGSYKIAETLTTIELGQTLPRVALESPYSCPSLPPISNHIKTNQVPPSAVQPRPQSRGAAETGSLFSQGEDDRKEAPTNQPKTTNKKTGDSRVKQAIDFYSEQYLKIHGCSADVVHGRDEKIIKDRLEILDGENPDAPEKSLEVLKDLVVKFLNLDDNFLRGKGYSLNLFPAQFNGLRLKQNQAITSRKEVAESGKSDQQHYFN